MERYIAKRFIMILPILLGVSVALFLMLHLIPGDPAKAMLGEHASPTALYALRERLGLNRPLVFQLARFLWGAAHLDFGRSIQSNNPAFQEALFRFPATIELALASMFIALFFGAVFGTLAAAKPSSRLDHLTSTASLLGLSMPIFWLGLLFILLFAVHFRWFPFSGRIFVGSSLQPRTHFYLIDSLLSGDFGNVKDVFGHLVLPAITLSTVPLAMIARTTRGALLEVIHQDYLRTALAKGLPPFTALVRHGFKNALIPIITMTGLQFGALLGGATLTETVFNWPGVGKLVVDAVKARDYPVVQATVFLIALSFVLVNTLVDISYVWIDPRVKHE